MYINILFNNGRVPTRLPRNYEEEKPSQQLVNMEVSEPISQPDQSPAAAAANPVSLFMSMDTRALDKARKRQLAEAKGYQLDKKSLQAARA